MDKQLEVPFLHCGWKLPHTFTLLAQDPFGDLLKKLMSHIHDHLEMPELNRDFGTQMYEQQVVEMSKDGERSHWGGGQVCGSGQGLPGLSLYGLWAEIIHMYGVQIGGDLHFMGRSLSGVPLINLESSLTYSG